MKEALQYVEYIKPSWAPPSWLFGPVWSVLYAIIAVTFTSVFYKVATREIPFVVGIPFVLNLVFNFAFTPLQFGLRSNLLAAIDIFLVLITLVVALGMVHKYLPWVTHANIPYLLWVCFATVLQTTILFLNWK